jgi:hypothetical protein
LLKPGLAAVTVNASSLSPTVFMRNTPVKVANELEKQACSSYLPAVTNALYALDYKHIDALQQ